MKIKFSIQIPAYPVNTPFSGEIELDAEAMARLVTAILAGMAVHRQAASTLEPLAETQAALFRFFARPIS